MAFTLNIQSSRQVGAAFTLNLGGDVPSTYIEALSAAISILSYAPGPVGTAFPESSIAAVSGRVSVVSGGASLQIIWTGKSPAVAITLIAAESPVLNRAPTKVLAPISYISLISDGVGMFIDRRIFPPAELFPGYSFDGTNLVIPLAALQGLSVGEADATTGDWRKVVQACIVCAEDALNTAHPVNSRPSVRPQTVKAFMLEDWNRKDSRFGRHMKRSVSVQFITQYPFANVVEE